MSKKSRNLVINQCAMRQEAIGGYFSLELPHFSEGEYHQDAIRLNSGRYCLEYILRVKEYKKVFLPYYMCDAVLQPINRLGIDYEFYHIDKDFHIAGALHPQKTDVVLYCNYFGLMDEYVKVVADKYAPNIIIDNTQAFFSRPLPEIDTFYTCRKFFGVADGAYLYINKEADFEIPQDYSSSRMSFLLDRLDRSAEEAFAEYHINEHSLNDAGIRRMSEISKKILRAIDYIDIAIKRKENFRLIDNTLRERNNLKFELGDLTVPMIYPLWDRKGQLRKRLIKNKIYVAIYWPNVKDWVTSDSIEYQLVESLIPIPIDQRYGRDEMNKILGVINQ